MQRKRKVETEKSCKNPGSGQYIVRGEKGLKKFLNDGYRRARIGGKYVRLYDPTCEEQTLVESSDFQYELKYDLNKALSQFNPKEQILLRRLLIEGMAMDKAVARMRKSREYYRQWFKTVALPKLRASLSDYLEQGKVIV